MKTYGLTPRSNNLIEGARFTGCFGQPDGFGSMLDVSVRRDGRLALTATWKDLSDNEHTWTVELDNEQRKHLAEMAGRYEPRLTEYYK